MRLRAPTVKHESSPLRLSGVEGSGVEAIARGSEQRDENRRRPEVCLAALRPRCVGIGPSDRPHELRSDPRNSGLSLTARAGAVASNIRVRALSLNPPSGWVGEVF